VAAGTAAEAASGGGAAASKESPSNECNTPETDMMDHRPPSIDSEHQNNHTTKLSAEITEKVTDIETSDAFKVRKKGGHKQDGLSISSLTRSERDIPYCMIRQQTEPAASSAPRSPLNATVRAAGVRASKALPSSKPFTLSKPPPSAPSGKAGKACGERKRDRPTCSDLTDHGDSGIGSYNTGPRYYSRYAKPDLSVIMKSMEVQSPHARALVDSLQAKQIASAHSKCGPALGPDAISGSYIVQSGDKFDQCGERRALKSVQCNRKIICTATASTPLCQLDISDISAISKLSR
jgi:hypothetical protein